MRERTADAVVDRAVAERSTGRVRTARASADQDQHVDQAATVALAAQPDDGEQQRRKPANRSSSAGREGARGGGDRGPGAGEVGRPAPAPGAPGARPRRLTGAHGRATSRSGRGRRWRHRAPRSSSSVRRVEAEADALANGRRGGDGCRRSTLALERRRRPSGRSRRPAGPRRSAGRGCRRRSGRPGRSRRRRAPGRPPAARRGSARGSASTSRARRSAGRSTSSRRPRLFGQTRISSSSGSTAIMRSVSETSTRDRPAAARDTIPAAGAHPAPARSPSIPRDPMTAEAPAAARSAPSPPCRSVPLLRRAARAAASSTSASRRSPTPTSRPSELDRAEPFYPLHVYVCERCLLVQLPEVASPAADLRRLRLLLLLLDELARARPPLRRATMIERFGLGAAQPGRRGRQQRRLPAAVLRAARRRRCSASSRPRTSPRRRAAKGIPTRGARSSASRPPRELVARAGAADLLLGNNVLAHVPDLNDFVAGLAIAAQARRASSPSSSRTCCG